MKNIEEFLFKNSFGQINFDKVIFDAIAEEINFKQIAYIEIKRKKHFFIKYKRYLKIIFTNATSKEILISKKNALEAIEFESQFSRLRSLNTEIE